MTVKIKPLSNRVVIKPDAAEEKTQGGIYIPTKSENKVVHGQVIAVGPGKNVKGKVASVSINVGQQVIFNQYSATEVELSGEEYLVVSEDDIVAIIE